MIALRDLGRVHIVGVLGAATSGLARLLCARGVTVSGSDQVKGERGAELEPHVMQ